MCILCEKTKFQDQSCGLGVENYTNFAEEETKNKNVSLLIEKLNEENRLYLELVDSFSRKKKFALGEEELNRALNIEQDNLFGGVLTQLRIQERKAKEEESKNFQERNAGALK